MGCSLPKGEEFMRKLFILAVVAVLSTACSNKTGNTKTENTANNVYYTSNGQGSNTASNAKYQIIDQEFDDMLAPESDYETLSAYELQACGDSYLPPANLKKSKKKAAATAKKKSTKTASKVTKNKKVVNNVTVHYVDGPAPVPAGTISSSSTTTTTSSSSTSNSYAGGTSSYSSGSTNSYSTNGSSYSSF